MTAAEAVTRARKLQASNEAIMRATLAQMPMHEGAALLAKLQSEWLRKQQEAAHAAPIGSRRTAQ